MRERLMLFIVVFWTLLVLVGNFAKVNLVDEELRTPPEIKDEAPTLSKVVDYLRYFRDLVLFRVDNVPDELATLMGVMAWLSFWIVILVIRAM